MSSNMIEHRGVVQRVEAGKAIVAMETAGCKSCGQGSSCGIGKMASSDGATALGAIAGFLGALAVARVAIGLVPGLMPAPQLIPISNQSTAFPKE